MSCARRASVSTAALEQACRQRVETRGAYAVTPESALISASVAIAGAARAADAWRTGAMGAEKAADRRFGRGRAKV